MNIIRIHGAQNISTLKLHHDIMALKSALRKLIVKNTFHSTDGLL
jgi:hypothetical protein